MMPHLPLLAAILVFPLLAAGVFFWRRWRAMAALMMLAAGLCWGADLADRLGLITPSPKLTNVYDQNFVNQVVPLDNMDFHNCSFTNVTFQFDGGNFYFEQSRFIGRENIKLNDPKIINSIFLLKIIGALTPQFADSWHIS